MKRLIYGSLISLALLPLALSQTPSSSDDKAAEQEVRAAIERYRTALTKRDAAALVKIWADDYTFINATGAVLTKAQRLENLKSGSTTLDSINEEEGIKVRVYGGDTAVAISRVTIKGQYSGKESSGQYRSSHTWARTPLGWQLVCNQLTPVAAP